VHRRVHLLHAAALEQRAVRGFLLLPKNFVAFVTSPSVSHYDIVFSYLKLYPPPSLNRFNRGVRVPHICMIHNRISKVPTLNG
jgi:hypothetical protein